MSDIAEVNRQLRNLKNSAVRYYEHAERPAKKEALSGFFDNAGVSLRFILSEKENILFAFLSLAVVTFVYFMGTSFLFWIPHEVWDKLQNDDGNVLLSIILLVWSFLCVGLAAYPLGICTACMGASYILHFRGRPSTIAECLKVVMPKSRTLWIFSWLDGWWTFLRILQRMPKKNDHTPLSVKLYREAVYQAWKLSSLGFIPSLLCGQGEADSCKNSLSFLKERFRVLAKLRIGYSLVCWIVAIAAYAGNYIMLSYIPVIAHRFSSFSFYGVAFFPLIAAFVLVMVVFRPLYIISVCRVYAFYAREKGIEIRLPETSSAFVSVLAAFAVLAGIIGVIFLYHDELGLSRLLSGI